MSQIATGLKRSLLVLVCALLAIVLLPLVWLTAIVMRPLLIVALLLACLGCVALWFLSPAFRRWFENLGEWQICHSGLRLATDVAVHPSHSWARIGADHVVVGADDFVPATLGPVQSVELPPVGSRVEQGDRLFTLRRGDRSLELRAPVSGTVITRNEALLKHPELVNEGPFADGWAVRLRADDLGEDRQRLLEGRRAQGWFRHQIDRLFATVLAPDALASTLPDGGTLVRELHRQIDDRTWNSLRETFFVADVPPT